MFIPLLAGNAFAGDVVAVKTIGMELARDIANEAVMICRKKGYQVSAVVVDRNGLVRAALRDDLAPRFTLQIAEEKANATVMAGIGSGEFRKNRGDIRPELNHVDGVIMLAGALPISAGGYNIGAIGVSGAPGGDIDEDCAKKARAKFEERLEFAD
ncbi:MAG: heme-binding protein [Gammaproteobacteria bacterium]|nr:heme-binding protein [Gammaproteobacteria bacterium]MDH5801694.1 heme-binding protein [Gammaproteobacteria bacterium]